MRKLARVLVMLLSFAFVLTGMVGCVPASKLLPHYDYSDGDGQEFNTELFYANQLEAWMGDPTTLYVEDEEGGYFYTMGTRTGLDFRMWRTRDLTRFEDCGIVYQKPANLFSQSSLWAPQLLWDPEADWQYYLGEDAGEGKGLYVLYFCANTEYHQLTAAFSKDILGPYEHFAGVNANGDYIDASSYLWDMEKIKGMGLYEGSRYGELYVPERTFIDNCPFIDPVSGDKYMYFVRTRNVDATNDIWGVKMKDWVTPDYATTTPLTAYGWTTIEKKEKFDLSVSGSGDIDEGPFMHYEDFTDDGVDNGTYYLSLSLGGTGDKMYCPIQALGNSPLGPFEKVQPEDGGFIIRPEQEVDIVASGHHDFFYIGDEIWTSYHTYEIISADEIGPRYWACDRVQFVENSKGQMVMTANGPSKTIQPLPEKISGYRNLAVDATVTVSDGDGTRLNDGVIAVAGNRPNDQYFTEKNEVKITLEWDNYVTLRAIMVYNSYSWNSLFESVEKITFETEDGKRYIEDLGYNLEANRVPLWYLQVSEEEAASGDYDHEAFDCVRHATSAAAEFDEIKVKKITLKIKKGKDKAGIGIPEIYALGKNA